MFARPSCVGERTGLPRPVRRDDDPGRQDSIVWRPEEIVQAWAVSPHSSSVAFQGCHSLRSRRDSRIEENGIEHLSRNCAAPHGGGRAEAGHGRLQGVGPEEKPDPVDRRARMTEQDVG